MYGTVRRALPASLAIASSVLLVAACGSSSSPSGPTALPGQIIAVGAENEYANVISQIGGKYASVTAIESSPTTDPHTFEANPSIANLVGSAGLVVQNGIGYDDYVTKIEAAASNSARRVIVVQHLLGLPDSTPNPHVWYKPGTMPVVAKAIASALSAIQPQHAAYFAARVTKFNRSLAPWYEALKQFQASYPHTPVATTEPVGDYMLQAAGAVNLTPFSMQADVMNGVDPAPQNISLQNRLLAQHRVKALLYNQQVTDTLTQTFLNAAAANGIPVVGVYETMPPGYDYQRWMLAEVQALSRAVGQHVSTQKL
jgi:zinc/manganese transport system substrate-binding protein